MLGVASLRSFLCDAEESASQRIFRPAGAWLFSTFYPRLAPWAAFCRRFAAAVGEGDEESAVFLES
jgi:hypothetical protein